MRSFGSRFVPATKHDLEQTERRLIIAIKAQVNLQPLTDQLRTATDSLEAAMNEDQTKSET